MVTPKDCVWGKEFFDTYMKHAKKTSYNNEELHQVASLSLIGQSIRNVRLRADQTWIDCRIHPFIIQSSGTGKNSAFNFMGTVSKAAGYSFEEHGKDSTAGIMGTVRRNGEVDKGDLAGSGFVAWKESQQLLKAAKSEHSSDLLEVINQALDPSGKVSRSLSGGKLEYNSRTSLFCTTYPPQPNGQLELVHQGFLPRTVFLYRRLDEDFYDFVNEKRDNNLPKVGKSNTNYIGEYEDDVQKLANTLKYIEDTVWEYGDVMREKDSHYAQGREHIMYFEGVDEGVSLNPSPVIDDILSDYPYKIRNIAKPFKTRMFDMTYKIAACLAAVDYDEETDVYVSRIIRERHANQAKKLVGKSFENIVRFIQDYMVETGDEDLNRLESTIEEICRNDSGQATVRELMIETTRKKRDIKDDIATLQEMGKIEAEKNPHTLEVDDKVQYIDNPDVLRY